MINSIGRTQLSKAQKRLFKQSFQDFKKFMQSEGIWKIFKWEIFKRYGWINVENMLSDNNIMPPEYLNYPVLIHANKSIDWGKYSVRWQTIYYKVEDKI